MINTGTILANAYFRFKPDYMKSFPIPAFIPENLERNIVEYVDKILELKSNSACHISIRKYENEIDEIVYSLYALTDKDIELIKSTNV